MKTITAVFGIRSIRGLNLAISLLRDLGTCAAVALACVVSGCGEKSAPTPAASPKKLQSSAPPAAQASGLPLVKTITEEPVAKKPAQPSEIFDLKTIMDPIAKEFTPTKDEGWDKFTMPKVKKWAKDNLYGKRGRTVVTALDINVTQDDTAGGKSDEWDVNFLITGVQAGYAGMANRLLPVVNGDSESHEPRILGQLGLVWGTEFYAFKCAEAEARKWDSHSKSGTPAVEIEGDIVEISFRPRIIGMPYHFLGYDTFVRLERLSTTISKDTEPVAETLINREIEGRYGDSSEKITEIKQIDSNGDYQLVFVQTIEASRTGNFIPAYKLCPFHWHDSANKGLQLITCSARPTEEEISDAKAKVAWPKLNEPLQVR